jgi:hypothetical protein
MKQPIVLTAETRSCDISAEPKLVIDSFGKKRFRSCGFTKEEPEQQNPAGSFKSERIDSAVDNSKPSILKKI